MDLVYYQYSTLYEILPDAPRPSLDPTSLKSSDVPPIDGIMGSLSQNSTTTSSKQKSVLNTGSNHHSKNPSNLGKTSEVNVIQSTTTDNASKVKKKVQGKETSDTPKHNRPKSYNDDASK